jgi:aldose 1-epimerase
MDFSALRALDVALDHCFAGWDGRATLRWPRSGVGVEVEATAAFGHVILYSPPGEPFFALEPVSNANDGFNLLDDGQAGTGVAVLAAGEALEGEVRIRVDA